MVLPGIDTAKHSCWYGFLLVESTSLLGQGPRCFSTQKFREVKPEGCTNLPHGVFASSSASPVHHCEESALLYGEEWKNKVGP